MEKRGGAPEVGRICQKVMKPAKIQRKQTGAKDVAVGHQRRSGGRRKDQTGQGESRGRPWGGKVHTSEREEGE